ncbi:MAG: hypothetical protein IPH20_03520 [Bacteroidales bacterium]|nr:hypothetical protein [Bacteroidales bacterium]
MNGLLLPYYWKIAGRILALAGIVMLVLYLVFDFRFTMPVFAIVSSFLETRIFVTFRTNFADELILILLISGFGLMVFSKEKEESENLNSLREKAMFKATILNNILLLCTVLFVYGSGFLAILVLNMISLLIFYLIFFYVLKGKMKSSGIISDGL